MPRLNDATLEVMNLKGTSYQYSATRIDHLGATEYTLVSVVVDISGSVYRFGNELEKCLQQVIEACRKSPRADNLLIRILLFNNKLEELHGYKLLTSCNIDDYKNVLKPGGETALYDATYNAVEATLAYGETLNKNDFAVNAIVFILTDGMDNVSTYGTTKVKEVLANAVSGEKVESMVSILVGVNVSQPEVDRYLDLFRTEANINQYVKIDEATPQKLAKLAEFVSKSISSQSQALKSGAPSQLLTI